MSPLEAVKYSRGKLLVLDQLRLPHELHYDAVASRQDAFDSIASMRVRGAPAIAIVASLGLAVELDSSPPRSSSAADCVAHIDSALDYVQGSRPTAVDLTNAVLRLKTCVRQAAAGERASSKSVVEAFIQEAEAIFERDLQTNLSIGQYGASWLGGHAGGCGGDKISILTHCNTGSLATSGHGTALGIVRTLHSQRLLGHVFCTETRPYNQGSRLTAFELVHEGIPATLITDSMAAALLRTRASLCNMAAVVVGADRVVRNGDTANKIGTYQLAVLARHHGIKFVVAAPTTSIDLETLTGDGIEIEERKPQELSQVTGAVIGPDGSVDTSTKVRVATADQRIGVWNPAFDVTPAALIDAIVTERGVIEKGPDGSFDLGNFVPERQAAAGSHATA
ncbi:hypothetical protein CDD81_5874 [Ophiocordyceps australis]|uniref:Methylthioribose-1-phosphate isomerase n=1 Tax=Ophiocordyceps australis TaxID=1399860 RepID=A0A2C5YHH2_9HYPO|nr:hypothetical protein CDD81_5874 [Ophiocordyceps australis]